MATEKGIQSVSLISYPSGINLGDEKYDNSVLVTKGFVDSRVQTEVMDVVKQWSESFQVTGAVEKVIQHDLGIENAVVQVYKVVTSGSSTIKYPIFVEYQILSADAVKICFPVPDDDTTGYSVVIMGAVFSS